MRNAWLCVLAIVLLGSGAAWGATITVNTTEPGVLTDGLCSLAEAIENANDGAIHADCVTGENGSDIIEFGQSEQYHQLEDTGYFITDDIVINGRGSTLWTSDQTEWRGLRCNGAVCIINDLTLYDGRDYALAVEGHGGRLILNGVWVSYSRVGVVAIGATVVAIRTWVTHSDSQGVYSESSTVLLADSTLSDSTVGLLGIDSDISLIRCHIVYIADSSGDWVSAVEADGGSLVIQDSYFDSNNNGLFTEAAVICRGGSQVHISGSTFYNNDGGVVDDGADEVSIVRSTFSVNNRGVVSSGPGVVRIAESTITENQLGIESIEAQIEFRNSIISGNVGNCQLSQSTGPSRGFNLSDDHSCNLDDPTDLIVESAMLSFPTGGGETFVYVPLEGSPAIDMAGETCSRFDQRGYLGPADGDGDGVAQCDCGSVEYGARQPPWPPNLPQAAIMPPAVN